MTSVLESVSHAYESFVEDPVEVDELKRLHTEYIKTLSIRKSYLIHVSGKRKSDPGLNMLSALSLV